MEKGAKLSLAASMLIFGTIGVFRKYIPLSSGVLAMARGYIGMACLLLLLFVMKRKPDGKAIKKNLLLLLVSGGFIGINWILLFEAYNHTSVAVATLCYYMAPIFVLIASPFVLKEKMTTKKIICVVAALIGMVMVSGVLESGFYGMSGILLGLGAALFYASVITLNQFIHDIGAYDKTIMQLGSAATVLIPYLLLVERPDLSQMTLPIIGLVIFVGVVHTGVAYALYFGSMDALSAQTIALYSYIDPIFAILLSALLLHEPMGPMEIIGAILILCATIFS